MIAWTLPCSTDKDVDAAKTEFLAGSSKPCISFKRSFLSRCMEISLEYKNQLGRYQFIIYDSVSCSMLDCILIETTSFSLPWLLFAELAPLLLSNVLSCTPLSHCQPTLLLQPDPYCWCTLSLMPMALRKNGHWDHVINSKVLNLMVI